MPVRLWFLSRFAFIRHHVPPPCLPGVVWKHSAALPEVILLFQGLHLLILSVGSPFNRVITHMFCQLLISIFPKDDLTTLESKRRDGGSQGH